MRERPLKLVEEVSSIWVGCARRQLSLRAELEQVIRHIQQAIPDFSFADLPGHTSQFVEFDLSPLLARHVPGQLTEVGHRQVHHVAAAVLDLRKVLLRIPHRHPG